MRPLALVLVLTATIACKSGTATAERDEEYSSKFGPLIGALVAGQTPVSPGLRLHEDKVQVYIYLSITNQAIQTELGKLGVAIQLSDPSRDLLQAWVPQHQLRQLAAIPEVQRITVPDYAVTR